MGTIVEAVVPAEEFALQRTSSTLPKVTFQLERVVAQEPEHIMPFMWVTSVDQTDFESGLEADPSVENFELVTDLGSKWLYQMNWIDHIETLVRTIVEEDAVLLEAKGSNELWELEFLFLDRKAIRRVEDHFEDVGMSFDAHRIYDQRESALGAHGLTEKQHHVLSRALERGYYDIPRTVNSEEFAAELGISHQALSEQLRRAHKAVVTDIVDTSASVLSERSDSGEQ